MVKAIRNSCIIFSFISLYLCAGNEEELFLRANKLYVSQEYDEALSLYEKMPRKGHAVLYNMGNCYFYKDDYPSALVYWERAQRGATSREYAAIYQNKKYVLEQLNLKNTDFYLTLIDTLDCINAYISLYGLQLLLFVLWYLFFIAYYRGRLKSSLLFFLLSLLLFVSFILMLYDVEKATVHGIISKKNILLYTGPNKGFDTVGSARYADRVIVREAREGWCKVKDSDKIGWVEADAIKII